MPTTSIHDILQQLRSVAYDKRDMGNRFELLMQAFLRLEPQYATLYSDVWLWNEYPERGTRVDTGIDLVAKDSVTGELTAIQCKFYAESTPVSKGDIDSFLAASSKKEFAARLIISTSDYWGKNAEDAVENQNPPVQRLRVQDLDESSIDWSQFSISKPSELIQKDKKSPFPHQVTAIEKVIDGFISNDRGKLIMACGTGKTFTALQIAQEMVRPGGTVLFLVPSISLLSQTLKEWTIEAKASLRSYAVCSDVSVGKRTNDEDIPITDLAYPATTNASKLVSKYEESGLHKDGLTVIFSTYQSIDVIKQAQEMGLPDFDLIICDEAHRTTGVTLSGDDESAFVRIHKNTNVRGLKRLYMTATPRIYNDASKSKAEEAGALLTDMDKAEDFGPEFHRLGFGEAVSIGRLTDYKVLVLAVDESYISSKFQKLLADQENSLALEDAAKIVGCWNGLAKRSLSEGDFKSDPEPMKRAVAFARNITESKKIAEMFETVVAAEIDAFPESENLLDCEVHHVDGTFNVLDRNKELDWLKQDPGLGKARILTNARCLSEGVDVPALDAVMFLNPRDSVVDVVQSVGRVMRKLEGKHYGYVILPIAVPTDVPADVALGDSKKYKVVWQVLQALRAHDERFDAMINKIDLTKSTDEKLSIIGVGGFNSDKSAETTQGVFEFPSLDEYKDAILARIVDKVGERGYWENWAKDIAGIASDHITRLKTLVDGSKGALRQEFGRFLRGLQDNLNPFISEHDALEMLSQHLITKPVFDALFDNYAFSENNPVSQVMQRMVDALEGQNLASETVKLEKFYASVRLRASGVTDPGARQHIVKELYEKFFRTAFADTSNRLGIVYTPNEIVDFIVHSVDQALRTEFGTSIGEKGVHVLDPFTGTGTFIVRLLQSNLLSPDTIRFKYLNELHANELVLLAYYVAAINIEETYHSLTNDSYTPFRGIVLTDTFQMTEKDDSLDGLGIFPENNERVKSQLERDIRVIIGNPPYSVGQTTANDDNANLKYATLDGRISETYVKQSDAKSLQKLYDSYIRSIRWATDRLGDEGVICFVTNGGFVDSATASGIRRVLLQEFDSVYIFNLRGNAIGAGEKRRKERDNVFGEGTKTTVVISLLIKKKGATPREGKLFYHDIGDYLTKAEKLSRIQEFGNFSSIPWINVQPNASADWINQRDESLAKHPVMGSKNKTAINELRYFKTYSLGLVTNRDSWAYNFNPASLSDNIDKLIANYNAEVDRKQASPDSFKADMDPRRISWSEKMKKDLEKKIKYSKKPDRIFMGSYRPFLKEYVYFEKDVNGSIFLLPKMFPTSQMKNPGICIQGGEFAALMVNNIPDMNFFGFATQFFPRFTFEANKADKGDLLFGIENEDEGVIDNITDEMLDKVRQTFGAKVTKDDIFHYIYGLLYSQEYRDKFGANISKEIPRVPLSTNFFEFSEIGKKLGVLHMEYENAPFLQLEITRTSPASNVVEKMRYGKTNGVTDKTKIVVNSTTTISNIPREVHDFKLGPRSALDWVLDRYQVKIDKASGIASDPNEFGPTVGNENYVIELIQQVAYVSLETSKIVASMPALDLLEQ